MTYRRPTIKPPRENTRLNARGEEILDDTPVALMVGREDHLTLHEKMLIATRDPRGLAMLDNGWMFSDDDDLPDEAPDAEVSPLPVHTPFTEGFSSSSNLSDSQLRKLAKSRGYELTEPTTEDAEPVGKTKPAKSAPIKQAPEPSLNPTGSDAE